MLDLNFLGGALAVHVAKECPQMIDALCVIDVVEGISISLSNHKINISIYFSFRQCIRSVELNAVLS